MIDIKVFASSSKGNCTLIDCNSPLLLDAGVSLKEVQRKMNFQAFRLKAVLITHSHADHAGHVVEFMRSGIDVYLSAETASEVNVDGHRVHIVKPMEQFEVGEWTCVGFPLVHDVFNLGYLLTNGKEKIVYITDSEYSHFTFEGVTHFLLEANYSLDILRANMADGLISVDHKARVMQSHMSLETCMGILAANDLSAVQEIWLLHLSGMNSDEELFKREVQKATGKPVYIGGVWNGRY